MLEIPRRQLKRVITSAMRNSLCKSREARDGILGTGNGHNGRKVLLEQ